MFHMFSTPSPKQVDAVLIGGGIMSATLGALLKLLQPQMKIVVLERLDEVAAESSDAWNNAGTGHAAYCELNYTPQSANGDVDISKALKISSSFEISNPSDGAICLIIFIAISCFKYFASSRF